MAPGIGTPSVHAFASRFAVADAGNARPHRARLRGSPRRDARIAGPARAHPRAVALCPLLLGPIALKRFDALPSLLTVVALLLLVRRRVSWSAFVLGVATAVKIYPLLLLPVVVAAALGRSRRAAVDAGLSFAAGCAVLVLPFLVLSPGGIESSIRWQFDRHLQFESTFASIALLAHTVAGVSVGDVRRGGQLRARGLPGHAARAAHDRRRSSPACCLSGGARPRLARSGDGAVLGFAATIAVVVAFARVLSPQYLLWLVPLVPLVRGKPGSLATDAARCCPASSRTSGSRSLRRRWSAASTAARSCSFSPGTRCSSRSPPCSWSRRGACPRG